MNTPKSKFIGFYILLTLLFFQGASGLFGGTSLVLEPTGETLQIPLSLLDGTPFDAYLIPGAILLLVLGVFPLIVLYGLIRRKIWGVDRHGSGKRSTDYMDWCRNSHDWIPFRPPLQLIYGSVGIVLLILTQLPSVQIALKSKALDHESIS